MTLGAPAWIIVSAVAIYVFVVGPLRGQRSYRRLIATRDTDPAALVWFYRRNIIVKWLLLIPIVVLMVIPHGVSPRDLGLAWPRDTSGAASGFALDLLVALVIAIPLSGLIWRFRVRRGRPVPAPRRARALLPRTQAERRWGAAVALTAGVTEEVLVRGLALTALVWAGLPLGIAVLVSSALFGLMHVYQGAAGVVATGIFGALMSWFYLATGSLLVPIVLHVLIDLRSLAWTSLPPTAARPVSPAPDRSASREVVPGEGQYQMPLVRKGAPD